MLLKKIEELSPVPRQAIIINAGTKAASTLALMSTLKYMNMPVLVIDCESDDGSLEHFSGLMEKYPFDLLTAPLKPHGTTLDWIFNNAKAHNILLVDSDLEILDDWVFLLIDAFIDQPDVFGCGFIHGPEWLTKVHTGFDHCQFGLYQERPWMPFAIFKTVLIREALKEKLSFREQWIYNDFSPSPFIARLLYKRFWCRSMQNVRLTCLNLFKQDYYGHKPSYVCCDTGAHIYQFLKYKRGYNFVGIPAPLHGKYARHYHGLTRNKLNSGDQNSAVIDVAVQEIRQRLKDVYQIEM